MTPDEVRIFEQREREADHARLVELAIARLAEKHEDHWRQIRGMRARLEPRDKMGVSLPAATSASAERKVRRSPHARTYAQLHVANGESRTMSEWAAYIGITPSGLHHLVRRHGSVEAALQVRRRRTSQPPGVGENLGEIPGDRRGEHRATSNENRVFEKTEDSQSCQ